MTTEYKNREQCEETDFDRNLNLQFISTMKNFIGEGTKKEKHRFMVGVVPRTLIAIILLSFVGSGCVETRKVIGDYSKQTRKKISKWANKKRTQSRTQNGGQYG